MSLLRRLARRLRHLFFSPRAEAEMAEEMRFHLEQRAASYAEDGLSEADARYAAQRRFGNLASIQEGAREAFGWGWLERFLKDVRLALRQLVRNPGFALLAIVTLALGIGVNTAMFSALRNVILKPLPYADSPRLDRLYRATPQDSEGGFSPADFLDLRRAQEGYGEVAAYLPGEVTLSEPGQPAAMTAAVRVTANFFALLGIPPQIGRDFGGGEDVPGNDRVVILSRRAWQRRFEGRPDVVGRSIRVDGEPHQIVGVLPETFNDWRHLGWVDVFRPLALDERRSADRGSTDLVLIGRRAPGRTRADSDALLAGLGARLAAGFPEVNAGSSWRRVPLDSTVVGEDAPAAFGMLIGLSGFVLLIACSNLANFLLARTIARAREFALRSALGASRLQLLRPLIAESLVLALAGGACAVQVALWYRDWLAVRSTGDNGERVVLALDWLVLAWALAAALFTALAFGLAPALFAMRLDLNQMLKSGGRGATSDRGHHRFRHALIVGQFALAMVLLAGAGLFVRGLDDLNDRRAGWESVGLVTGTYVLPASRYAGADEITSFQRRALERLEALPGVASAGIASFAPYFSWTDSRKFVVEGRERPEPGHEPAAFVNAVTPGHFETFGTRLLAGRAFGERDTQAAPRVFIINQALARQLFGEENPVGRRLARVEAEALEPGEIVGVAADVESVLGDEPAAAFQVYLPMGQDPRRRNELAVRTIGVVPSTLVESIRATMMELDADLPVRKLQPAEATVTRANYQLGVFRDMLISFAVLGLGLALIGIYGVIARVMAQRTGEFAIRLALGGSVADITSLVLATGARQALAGSALGLLGAFGVSRLLAAGFPGVRTDSPGILLATMLLLVAVALLACWLPARRAGRIDPTLALRAE